MGQFRTSAALYGLLLLGVLLMVVGTQGSLGRMLCVIVAPGRLAIRDQSQRSGVVHNIVQSVTPPNSQSQGSQAL